MGNIVASVVMVFVFVNQANEAFKWYWFLAMLAVMFLRLVDAGYWFFKLKHANFDTGTASSRFLAGSIATAIMWSIYAVKQFPTMDAIEFATTYIIVAGLAGGASSVLSGHKNAASLFIAVILFPLSVLSLFSEMDYRQLLGALGVFFGAVLLISARKSAGFTTHTLKLRNDNAQLLEQMHQEQDELNRVNQELSSAYAKLNEAHDSLESEVKRRTERIAELSNLDPLTGIYNRSAFTEQLKELMKKREDSDFSLALLFIDLNGFKKINDTLGHKVGDAVLTEIASRLEAFANDYHAGRWGGDEFLIALPYADKDTALSVANALLTRIAQPLDVLSNRLNLSASVGIAMYPEHSKDELELIQLADFAMFEQKKSGKKVPRIFDLELIHNLKEIQALRDGLQQAIDKKQLYLCYQPIVSSVSKQAKSFEALLRWDFAGKLISPGVFIPLAEQSGFIKEIGSWVLHRACIDARQWQDSSDASVSVNVSVMQLLDDGFLPDLDKALATSGIPPEKLYLEITESMFADNKDKVCEQIDKIKARNVQVSIDDFGTGYSSLSQLQNLSFDIIKIDRSFVNNVSNGGEAIIRATIFIAREFGCKTVAEGVETEDQADALLAMGVDFLQGFLYAKPVRKDYLDTWLDAPPISTRRGSVG